MDDDPRWCVTKRDGTVHENLTSDEVLPLLFDESDTGWFSVVPMPARERTDE